MNCDKYCYAEFDEKSNIKFENTYKFCNGGLNKFVLLLQKVVYPNEYKGSLVKFNETLFTTTGNVSCSLNLESISKSDQNHKNKV